MEHPIGTLPPYTLSRFAGLHPQGSVSLDSRVASLPYESSSLATSRGNEKYGEEKQRVIYFMYYSAVSPFGGERSEPITRMLNMLYDAESQSRNADFILIARRAPPQPSGPKAPSNLRTLRPRGRSILRTFPSEPSEPSEPFEPGPRSGPMPLFYA